MCRDFSPSGVFFVALGLGLHLFDEFSVDFLCGFDSRCGVGMEPCSLFHGHSRLDFMCVSLPRALYDVN